MFSLSQRFQTVANNAVTVGMCMVAFIVATSWIQLIKDNAFDSPSTISNIIPRINIRTSRYYGSLKGKPKENARVSFDLDTDLSSLFNWNTKQVFVFLTAEYNSTNGNTISEVTFWDKIIDKREDAKIVIENAKSKYAVWDVSEKLSGKDLKFKLHWNIQPWVGPLVNGEANGEYSINIPKPEKAVKSD